MASSNARAEGVGPGGGARTVTGGHGARCRRSARQCSVRQRGRQADSAVPGRRPRGDPAADLAGERSTGAPFRRLGLWTCLQTMPLWRCPQRWYRPRPERPGGPGRRDFPTRPHGSQSTAEECGGRRTRRASPHLWTGLWTTGEQQRGHTSSRRPLGQGRRGGPRPALRGDLEHLVPGRPRPRPHRRHARARRPELGRRRADPHQLPRAARRRGPGAHRRAARRSSCSSTPRPAREELGRARSAHSARRAAARRTDERPARRRRRRDAAAADDVAEPPLHVRPVRHRRVEPLRARRRAVGRREPGPVVQPAVHLRAGRSRQDPPAARDRPSRARRCSRASASATSRPRR